MNYFSLAPSWLCHKSHQKVNGEGMTNHFHSHLVRRKPTCGLVGKTWEPPTLLLSSIGFLSLAYSSLTAS